MRIWLVCLAVVLCACDDDEPAAPLTPGGGPGHEVGTGNGKDDAGDDQDAGTIVDAATPDAGDGGKTFGDCMSTPVLFIPNEEMPSRTSTAAPDDFLVSRQEVTWTNGCEAPTLVIELSDGICPEGRGHELAISLPVNAILDGQIGLGFNLIVPEMDSVAGITARYSRPMHLSPRPVGLFGTCEGAMGQMNFFDTPDVTRPMNLRANYDLILTACDGSGNTPILVSGYFDIRVRNTLDEVCP